MAANSLYCNKKAIIIVQRATYCNSRTTNIFLSRTLTTKAIGKRVLITTFFVAMLYIYKGCLLMSRHKHFSDAFMVPSLIMPRLALGHLFAVTCQRFFVLYYAKGPDGSYHIRDSSHHLCYRLIVVSRPVKL